MNGGDIALAVITTVVFIWDLLTWPLYQLLQRPWEKRQAMNRCRARVVRRSDDEIVYEATPEKRRHLVDAMTRAKCATMADAWKFAMQVYGGERELLGTRDVLAEEDEVQPNGKIFKKLDLGDYRWLTYDAVDSAAECLGRGLRALKLNRGEKACLFADTRAEFFITAQAAFKQGFPVVTLYTNLGEEAVVHGLNQTKATHVVTSHELLPKFRRILKHTDSVKHIVFFEDQIKTTDTSGFREDVVITPFWDVISIGKKLADSTEVLPTPPAPEDPAIIMYTSGSTGVPKGVIISHRNMYNALKSLVLCMDMETNAYDAYVAFLPLAHVLELICESVMFLKGVRVGYSTPNTLLDKSSMVKRGRKGDASVLRPTVMAAVPLILDRVFKTITEALSKSGSVFEKVFTFCYEYRKAAVNKGENTPIMDFLVFRKLRALFGGRIRVMVCGGAPLSSETHDFIRICMGCPVLQGYGLTETTACATLSLMEETTTARCGPPNPGTQIALVNWEEGNYRVTDLPRPRGEVLIGGPAITEGYYEMPEKTAEDFFEAHGRRWFRSGDIGQINADGTLSIIDRKKDLVKLQFGEYVSLGKVEACLKTCPIVDNICIYGDSARSYCVALLTPDPKALTKLAQRLGKEEGTEFELLCRDRDITGAVLRQLVNHGKSHALEKFEIPGAVTLCKEAWTPESGLVTAAFKLKRKPIQTFYQHELDRMYGVSASRGV